MRLALVRDGRSNNTGHPTHLFFPSGMLNGKS